MNILVTGGAGFIGKHLVKNLVELGHNITVADFNDPCIDTVHYFKINLASDDWDIINGNFDVIYHLAAQPYGRGSEEEPYIDLKYNTEAFLKMCYFAKLKKVKKVIYTSSMAVYGNNTYANETDILQPLSNYAVSKLYGEFCLKKFAADGSFVYSILRLWNTYGIGQDLTNKNKGIVSSLAQQVCNSNLINVTGALDRYRDLIHVNDVVNSLLLCLDNITNNETFNVCSSMLMTVDSIIKNLIIANNKLFDDYSIKNIGTHDGDQHGCVGNNDKLRSIGWNVTVPIEEGFAEFINYIKTNNE